MNIKRFSLIKDILMFICLIGLMLTPYLARHVDIGRAWYFLGLNWHFISWHVLFGCILTILFIIHIAINIKWLAGTAKAWGKANAATKAKFFMMILVCLTMWASIITGILWALGTGVSVGPTTIIASNTIEFAGVGPSSTIALWHTITSWAAFYFTGIHIGLHLTKFLSFTQKPKPKAPPAAPPTT